MSFSIAKQLNLQFVLDYMAEEFAKSLHHIAEGKIDCVSHGQSAQRPRRETRDQAGAAARAVKPRWCMRRSLHEDCGVQQDVT